VEPAGHIDAAVLPLAQYEPTGHKPLGIESPEALQNEPPGHASDAERPVALENVAMGHVVGAVMPVVAQKVATGHAEATPDDAREKKPAAEAS
jgi:hypothetical protein